MNLCVKADNRRDAGERRGSPSWNWDTTCNTYSLTKAINSHNLRRNFGGTQLKIQRFCVAISTFVVVCLAAATFAQQGYKKPPKEVLDILNAPVTPGA